MLDLTGAARLQLDGRITTFLVDRGTKGFSNSNKIDKASSSCDKLPVSLSRLARADWHAWIEHGYTVL